ncbi:putative nadh-dependent flavin [Phaeomoniella chlamydospora]|uniref:Putative nadh-dependent flavin n=1 Tax=Phaeomoniella chlamydospora TaxID=158046 RepID=A0A0G2GDK9_PHACM|nr:putative nadh-dependent flavin [Phaeomoniella chlamydospora]
MGSIDLKSAPSPSVAHLSTIPYFTPLNNAGAALDPSSPDTPTLFQPLQIRSVTLKNRIMVAPMCQYSCEPNPSSPFVGALTDYHLVHLGHFALKGASLVIIEASAVQTNGRITPWDTGLWQFDQGTSSEQFKGLKRVVDFCHSQGSKVGIQLAHAGRKASTSPPWLATQAGVRSIKADSSVFGWPDNVVGPTGGDSQAWSTDGIGYWPPRELSTSEVEEVVLAFQRSAELAVKAGVDVIEIHAAHGYLIHQFLSPVTNHRTDKYGGNYLNRIRILTEIATAIRSVIPDSTPLFLRISATEWLEDIDIPNHLPISPTSDTELTWSLPSTLKLTPHLPLLGIDLLDVSSGGNHSLQKIQPHNTYQIDLASEIRKHIRSSGDSTTLIGAVGLITEAERARDIVRLCPQDTISKETETSDIKLEAQIAQQMTSGPEEQRKADVVLVGRQFLRESEWVMKVAKELGVGVHCAVQFGRA